MNVAVFSSHSYDRIYLEQAKQRLCLQVTFCYHEQALASDTVSLAAQAGAVCVFVNDVLNEDVLKQLHHYGVRAILLRCAGYNNIDLHAAERLSMFVSNVPSYSPESIAEFAVGLLQAANRKICIAHDRVRLGNFMLDGLLGSTLSGKVVGIIGTGRIGIAFAQIMKGFGCTILAHDITETMDLQSFGTYVELEALLRSSDVVSLHCPLNCETQHLINRDSLSVMKPGAILVNVSRGGLVDAEAVVEALKMKHLGSLAIDVYEREASVFYHDRSTDVIEDDTLARLMTFPNVVVTGHQAFFTAEAMSEIADTVVECLECFLRGWICKYSLVCSNVTLLRTVKPIRV
jgi:D-lactate dehydrogenase